MKPLLAILAAVLLLAGCGGQSSSVKPSPTPHLAPSVAATLLPDPATRSALRPLIVSVWLRDEVTQEQRACLAEHIARMPEVREFAFVSKRLSLLRLLKRLGILVWPRSNPVPASFEIVVKSRGDVLPLARSFFTDPLVDNDPGTHDGVSFARSPTSP